jgi:pilus assembly protein CpaF
MSEPDTARLTDAVRGRLAGTGPALPTVADVAAAVRAEGGVLGDAELLSLADRLRADLVGAGPLEPLLRDPAVTDVLVNGPDEVWVDAGSGLARANVRFAGEPAVRRLAQRLAAAAGRRLDDAAPYADARLPGGVRLHAVLPPIARDGTCLSLRLPSRRAFTLDELVGAGTVTRAGASLLSGLVAARAAFLITGGTGTGKTTLLSSALSMVGPGERLVLVEDSAELAPDHPHVVRLEARPPNVEGAGGVTLHDLVRQALRMRPDRLVVGEVRGAEVVELNVKRTPTLSTWRHRALLGSIAACHTPRTAALRRSNVRRPILASSPTGSPGRCRTNTCTRTTPVPLGSVTGNGPNGTGCWPTSAPGGSMRSSSTTVTG